MGALLHLCCLAEQEVQTATVVFCNAPESTHLSLKLFITIAVMRPDLPYMFVLMSCCMTLLMQLPDHD